MTFISAWSKLPTLSEQGSAAARSLSVDMATFPRRFSKENICEAMNNSADTTSNPSDWHPADVLAALKKRGRTLTSLSRAHGYHPTAAGKALKRSWPAIEAIIARELGRSPQEIWPSRYDANGDPLPRIRK
ncbi:MAG TPA: helix-turn-helix domain-containing protein [Acetobacteraceae bacterium]